MKEKLLAGLDACKNIPAEQAVLGAMLMSPQAVDIALELLTVECFAVSAHQVIYSAIQHLVDKRMSVDVVSVAGVVTGDERVTQRQLSELLLTTVSPAAVGQHARIVFEAWIKRVGILSAALDQGQFAEPGGDAFEALEAANVRRSMLEQAAMKHRVRRTLASEAIEAMDGVTAVMRATDRSDPCLFGFDTGLVDVDNLLTILPGDLVLLAARPGVGKSSFALQSALHMAVRYPEHRCLMWSIEMSARMITTRYLSEQARVPLHVLRNGTLNDVEYLRVREAATGAATIPLDLEESIPTIEQIRSVARIRHREGQLGVLFVDYLQMIGTTGKHQSREQEVSAICAGLKAIAKDLSIPVIAVCTMSRAVESRTGRRPMLSDLRESGRLESDADAVVFLHRPELYGETVDSEGRSLQGVCEVIVAKQRNGPTGMVRLRFEREYTRFNSLTSAQDQHDAHYTHDVF